MMLSKRTWLSSVSVCEWVEPPSQILVPGDGSICFTDVEAGWRFLYSCYLLGISPFR